MVFWSMGGGLSKHRTGADGAPKGEQAVDGAPKGEQAVDGAPKGEQAVAHSRLPAHLVEELRAGRVIAFIGAGFSVPAGFPGWKKLLLQIASTAREDGALPVAVHDLVVALLSADWPSAAELDQAAQLIDDELPHADGEPQERLVSYMRRFLVPREYPLPADMERRLSLLRSLPLRGVLTTNFNPLLSGITPFDASAPATYRRVLRHGRSAPQHAQSSAAHDDLPPAELNSIATSDADGLHYPQSDCPVMQLHGSLRQPRSIVFTREGYRRLLYTNRSYQTFIKSAMSSFTVLYLGFSFSDAYLNELRSEIVSLLGRDGPPTAYAVVNDKSELQCRFFLQHEGVQMISFDTSTEGWGGFDSILEELAAAC
jgi:hypothetical protein